jgi:hypothetical protein
VLFNAKDVGGSMTSTPVIETDSKLSLVAFKAFGDLVIAVNCVERRASELRTRMEILLGRHLRPLFDAIEPRIPVRMLDHREASLPSLFTIKKDGPLRALASAAELKRAVMTADIPRDNILLFDQLGLRERFVTMGWRQVAIPKVNNIYLSYDRFFDGLSLPLADETQYQRGDGPLRVFPGSRVPMKNLPVNLVRDIIATAKTRGIVAELMLLEGERPDIEASGLPFTLVPRNFLSMTAAVRDAGKIVSADSMPAHIAEHVGRKMFVFSPAPNRYWLPRSAYLKHWDAQFSEGGASSRLEAFLDTP